MKIIEFTERYPSISAKADAGFARIKLSVYDEKFRDKLYDIMRELFLEVRKKRRRYREMFFELRLKIENVNINVAERKSKYIRTKFKRDIDKKTKTREKENKFDIYDWRIFSNSYLPKESLLDDARDDLDEKIAKRLIDLFDAIADDVVITRVIIFLRYRVRKKVKPRRRRPLRLRIARRKKRRVRRKKRRVVRGKRRVRRSVRWKRRVKRAKRKTRRRKRVLRKKRVIRRKRSRK